MNPWANLVWVLTVITLNLKLPCVLRRNQR
jgi:hypothetical protein